MDELVERIVAFLRSEADAARHAQANAADDHPDKLYRMGQKDGLLLAADAIERGNFARTPSPQVELAEFYGRLRGISSSLQMAIAGAQGTRVTIHLTRAKQIAATIEAVIGAEQPAVGGD